MKLLLDTNIFIPLEPGGSSDISPNSRDAALLSSAVLERGHQVFLHPAISADIQRDKDSERAGLRRKLARKYPSLPDPPSISEDLGLIIGKAKFGTNDWVDDLLLAALEADAVDLLVTEDKGIRRKARRLQLSERVVTLREAVEVLSGLQDRETLPPPAVELVRAHAIRQNDPILNSFRDDYPGFDRWFEKCRREHRLVWLIREIDESTAGFCLFKEEKDNKHDLKGKALKLCSFKVSGEHNGFRYGELLLKAALDYAFKNNYSWCFITLFEKQSHLSELLEDFGFSRLEHRTPLDELILAKPLKVQGGENLPALDFHVRYGPRHFRTDVPWHLVPIQPRFSDVLFPETTSQSSLFPGMHAFGNAVRKAYLCHSGNRSVEPGDVIAFYRSEERQGIIAYGVVERAFASNISTEIARAVVRRTVYSIEEIEQMCEREVLAILFRQARLLDAPLSPDTLQKAGVFSRPPQSIQNIQKEGIEWLKSKTLHS